ncbi:B3 domain-containing protein [Cucumis melo var. makuwa]|uniref:B3 domain-containing protein n=1 Tax=Cucumis melo var. makuwa TaxID=1194695 RepID=A0A5D3BCY0_CUCMM|nr:B3 domain-containing protein [Cucumis melo var. makuwa]
MGIWLINGIHIPRGKRSGNVESKQEESIVSSSLCEGRVRSEMAAAMRDQIVRNDGYEIQLVIEKKLEESDVS